MKANLLSLWRSHFVDEEGMLEVECSTLTPEAVLKCVCVCVCLCVLTPPLLPGPVDMLTDSQT